MIPNAAAIPEELEDAAVAYRTKRLAYEAAKAAVDEAIRSLRVAESQLLEATKEWHQARSRLHEVITGEHID